LNGLKERSISILDLVTSDARSGSETPLIESAFDLCEVCCLDKRDKVALIYTMKTANVADLRNDFRKVATWISDGETVAIKMRGRLFATLIPARDLNEPAMPKLILQPN
jgi:hypothetical protein